MRPMLVMLYFTTGFFVGAAGMMFLALALQPILLSLGGPGRIFAAASPLLVGLLGGFRTAMCGYSTGRPLSESLKHAYFLGSRFE
ncbi:MAG: hypothetical protein ACPGQS_13100 [Bradymonadia bacterium]